MNDKAIQFLNALKDSIGNQHLATILSKRCQRSLKHDESYVTGGDLLVQEVAIKQAMAFFENPLIISEEMTNGAANPGKDRMIVVIDPVDGTENFTSGLCEWGISVSCYLNGTHQASMIGCPEMGQWLTTGDPLVKHQSRIRGLSSSLTKEQIVETTEGHEYRITGCCVYNMLSVIRGSFLSFENPKGVWSWDILGGLNIALEHALNVTVENKNYAGEYLTPDRRYRFKVSN